MNDAMTALSVCKDRRGGSKESLLAFCRVPENVWALSCKN